MEYMFVSQLIRRINLLDSIGSKLEHVCVLILCHINIEIKTS
jgi:hypothetical protein